MSDLKLTFSGQAGFIIETGNGYRIGIDLYLSNCCERYFGFKRLMPYIYNPLDLELDLLVATHAHYDHFDPDSIPLVMKSGETKLLCAFDCQTEVRKLGLKGENVTYFKQGDVFENQSIKIKAMPCDHGSETPFAIGLLIEADEKKIYIAGDTCFRQDYFNNDELKNVDVFIMPINGAFGNMNEIEGAKASSLLNPKLTVPCHYWNFAEHGGNPFVFANEMKEKYPENKYILMCVGESISL